MHKLYEKSIVTRLAKYLSKTTRYRIGYWTNYVLRSSRAFPTRPEIDLIICRIEKGERVLPILGAEVKYIHTTKDGIISPSYYSGLDEALALLLLGFDSVLLIHIAEKGLLTTAFLDYAKILSSMIRVLRLPMGYRVYAFSVSGSDIFFYRSVELRTGSIIRLENLWVKPPLNPLLTDSSGLGRLVKENREVLARALGIRLNRL